MADAIRERTDEGSADITPVMADINALLDRSIAADGFRIAGEGSGETGRRTPLDLSAIDFEALAKRFATTTRKNIELAQLRAAVRTQLDTLVRANPTRADFLTTFEALIESYNAGSRNIDELFQDLLALSRSLSDEEQRHVRERLTEEELTVFDLLTRPGPDLAPAERDEVKKVARHLLDRVHVALAQNVNWRGKVQARAQVREAIATVLDEGLPRRSRRRSTIANAPFYSSTCLKRFQTAPRQCEGRPDSLSSQCLALSAHPKFMPDMLGSSSDGIVYRTRFLGHWARCFAQSGTRRNVGSSTAMSTPGPMAVRSSHAVGQR